MSTVGGRARGLRAGSLFRLFVLLGVIAAAFMVSRGCQRSYIRITQDQAVAIGQKKVKFTPEGDTIRYVQRGIPPQGFWAVSYWIRNRHGGGYRKVTVVLINANTGKIANVFVERS